MHSTMKMFSFELMLKNEMRKSMELAIPMWHKYHFKEGVEMVKGSEEKYTWTKEVFWVGSKAVWEAC